jgi:hypothetical protein
MISIENANLELALADLMATALSISKRVAHAIYFTPRAAALRIDILEAAAKAKLTPKLSPDSKSGHDHPFVKQKREALQKIIKLTKRSHGVTQRRHDVIHDAWGVAYTDEELETDREGSRPVISSKLKVASFTEAQVVPITSLTDLVRDLRILIDNIHSLGEEFRRHPPSMADLRKSSTKSGSSARAVKDGKPAS